MKPNSVVVLLAAACGLFYGQGVTGRIQGTVHDPTGAVVPGATVTITNQETGYKADVPTTQAGEYLAPNIPPGRYTVSVNASGFKTAVSRNVVVIVDSLSTVDFGLEVGTQTEAVQVSATAQL